MPVGFVELQTEALGGYGSPLKIAINIAKTGIDLSFVDKQTALVGTVGRMLVKHSIVLTDILIKFNIFCKLSK